jgi:SAM-dependent methyltransferase
MTARSHSSLPVPFSQKFREAITFLSWRLNSRTNADSFNWLFDGFENYRTVYEQQSGRSFEEARVLEIGFGARPQRLIGLMSAGINVRGIDLDMPMLGFSLPQLARIMKKNGPERALKSVVRSLLFDARDRTALREALRRRGHDLHIDRSRFLVGDAADFDYGSEPFDFVYSEDVFEHIPAEALERLVARLARIIRPGGIALITPNIFTGITGGHLVEWYGGQVNRDMERKSEPWEHLRKKRLTANTYLNQLPRSAYREMFARHFTILDENVKRPDLGRQWLTPEVKDDLAGWDDEELFSNAVQFTLCPKTA